MKIVSWNVNSVRARQDRVLAWLEKNQPDALCLQELKVVDDDFPHDAVRALGYRAVTHGQKTYNGVAILSRNEATDVVRGFGDDVDDPQSRLIAATVDGVRVVSAYVPNGGEVDSDKYRYKLEWFRRLRAWLDRSVKADAPLALCGDFNVAPDERDVHDPGEWSQTVLFNDAVRAALKTVMDFGLVDTYRIHHAEPGAYSWWDYRQLAFPKNRGLRIDLVLATAPLAKRCRETSIDRNERKGKQASDHVPVIAVFE